MNHWAEIRALRDEAVQREGVLRLYRNRMIELQRENHELETQLALLSKEFMTEVLPK